MTEDEADWLIHVAVIVCIDETDGFILSGYDVLTRQQLYEALYVCFYGATGTKSSIKLCRVNVQPRHVTLYITIDSRIFFARARSCGTEAFRIRWFNGMEKPCQLLVPMEDGLHLFLRPCTMITRLGSDPSHVIHRPSAEANRLMKDFDYDDPYELQENDTEQELSDIDEG